MKIMKTLKFPGTSEPYQLRDAEAEADIINLENSVTELKEEMGNIIPTTDQPYMQLVTDADGEKKWEERLAYDGRTTGDYLLEEITLTPAPETSTPFYTDVPIVIPQDKILNGMMVIWNGESYLCAPQSVSLYGKGWVVYGNPAIFAEFLTATWGEDISFPSTGEPFVLIATESDGIIVYGMRVIVSTSQSIAGSTIAIRERIGELKKIDEKFIPFGPIVFTINEEMGEFGYSCNSNNAIDFQNRINAGVPVCVHYIVGEEGILGDVKEIYTAEQIVYSSFGGSNWEYTVRIRKGGQLDDTVRAVYQASVFQIVPPAN